jgi:hypothetical protein
VIDGAVSRKWSGLPAQSERCFGLGELSCQAMACARGKTGLAANGGRLSRRNICGPNGITARFRRACQHVILSDILNGWFSLSGAGYGGYSRAVNVGYIPISCLLWCWESFGQSAKYKTGAPGTIDLTFCS